MPYKAVLSDLNKVSFLWISAFHTIPSFSVNEKSFSLRVLVFLRCSIWTLLLKFFLQRSLSLLKACIYWVFLRFSRVYTTSNCPFAGFFSSSVGYSQILFLSILLSSRPSPFGNQNLMAVSASFGL